MAQCQGLKDIPVPLSPLRHKDLSPIYQTFRHPKRPPLPSRNGEEPHPAPGRIFYFIQDTSKEGLRRAANLEKTLKILQGDETEAVKQGK